MHFSDGPDLMARPAGATEANFVDEYTSDDGFTTKVWRFTDEHDDGPTHWEYSETYTPGGTLIGNSLDEDISQLPEQDCDG